MEPHHSSTQRGLISRVLQPALNLWLRSQVESAKTLQVHLEGSNRQVLSGIIPYVTLEACQVVYRDLHLSSIQITGQDIHINIGQILKGQSLRLLETVLVTAVVQLDALDLQRSLRSALLQEAIIEALLSIVGEQIEDALGTELSPQNLRLQSPSLQLEDNRLRFGAQLLDIVSTRSVPITLQTGLRLESPNVLSLQNLEWLPTPNSKRGLPLQDLEGHKFDLGDDCQLSELSVQQTGIQVSGQLSILPA